MGFLVRFVLEWDGGERIGHLFDPYLFFGRGLRWSSLHVNRTSSLMFAASQFGDLASFRSLSRCSKAWRWRLDVVMVLFRRFKMWCRERPGQCHLCGDFRLEFGRLVRCSLCDCGVVCEGCLWHAVYDVRGHLSHTICAYCSEVEESEFHRVESLRDWFLDQLDRFVRRVMLDYAFGFYFRWRTIGDNLKDERGEVVSELYTRWDCTLDRVWSDVYFWTGGRVRQLVVGGVALDGRPESTHRWSRLVSREAARAAVQSSPLEATVVLRGWY